MHRISAIFSSSFSSFLNSFATILLSNTRQCRGFTSKFIAIQAVWINIIKDLWIVFWLDDAAITKYPFLCHPYIYDDSGTLLFQLGANMLFYDLDGSGLIEEHAHKASCVRFSLHWCLLILNLSLSSFNSDFSYDIWAPYVNPDSSIHCDKRHSLNHFYHRFWMDILNMKWLLHHLVWVVKLNYIQMQTEFLLSSSELTPEIEHFGFCHICLSNFAW